MRTLQYICLVMLLLGMAVATAVANPVVPPSGSSMHPPFRWAESYPFEGELHSWLVRGSTLFLSADDGYGAVDLESGHRFWWRQAADEATVSLEYKGDRLWVSVDGEGLTACRPESGEETWRLPLDTKSHVSWFEVAGPRLIVEQEPGVLAAFSLENSQQLWRASILPVDGRRLGKRRGLTDYVVADEEHLLVSTWDGETLCLNVKTGRILWRRDLGVDDPGNVYLHLIAAGQVLCSDPVRELVSLDLLTGRELWTFAPHTDLFDVVRVRDSLVCLDSEASLYGLRLNDGKLRWERSLSAGEAPMVEGLFAVDTGVVAQLDASLVGLDLDGVRRWSWNLGPTVLGKSCQLTADGLLISGEVALQRLRMGAPPPIPESWRERKALARRLLERQGSWTLEEEATFRRLGQASFEAAIPVFRRMIDEVVREQRADHYGKAGERWSRVWPHLRDLAEPRHTSTLIGLAERWERAGLVPDIGLVEWLASHGDRRGLPFLIRTLAHPNPRFRHDALERISHSTDPEAVGFMLNRLRDPNSEARVRNAAYCNLAGTGGDRGLEAVRAGGKEGPAGGRMLEEQLGLSRLPLKVDPPLMPGQEEANATLLATHRDARGVLWGLIESSVLGSSSDLWIVREEGKKWRRPRFTGVSDYDGFYRRAGDPRFSGMTPDEMVEEGWIRTLLSDRLLDRDADGDGWTDYVEQRVGTRVDQPDTDGDGVRDSEDGNPLAGEAPRTEIERALAVAFEARYKFLNYEGGFCLMRFPQGVRPISLPGWNGILLAVPGNAPPHPVLENARLGTTHVGCAWEESYVMPGGRRRYREGDLSRISSDPTEIAFSFTSHWGGCVSESMTVTVRKIQGRWLPVRSHRSHL